MFQFSQAKLSFSPRRLGTMLLAVIALAGCASLPSSGPTKRQIEKAAPGGPDALPFTLIPLDLAAVGDLGKAPISTDEARLAALATSSPLYRIDAIRTGDILKIDVFEIGVSLFSPRMAASMGAPSATAKELDLRVREDGTIDIPYLGTFRAADVYPEQLAKQIKSRLQRYSQSPEVAVTIASTVNNSVYIQGAIGKSGRYPITEARERLLDMIAVAGGATVPLADARVKFVRGDFTADLQLGDIALGSLANIPLLPGDRIEILRAPRSFLVFGASDKLTQLPFETAEVTLAEAIARAAGPSDARADPRGVFLFRLERSADGKTIKPTVYEINMLKADTYFTTQLVQMHDKDVLVFAKARSNVTQKLITLVNQLFTPVLTTISISRNVLNL